MSQRKNFLLIGNSRLHWANCVKNITQFTHSPTNESLPQDISLEDTIWASVGHTQLTTLKKENEIKLENIPLNKMPSYFGIDRALGCFAALNIANNPLKKNLLIADLGTTLSISKIDSIGNIIGGQLVPGLLTQLKAMDKETKNLQAPSQIAIPKQDFLLDTKQAMIKGVSNSLIGAINLSFNPKKDILILCGGDSKLIGKKIMALNYGHTIIEPNLVMRGMIKLTEEKDLFN